MLRATPFALLMVTASALPASADYDSGVAAYQRGDFAAAIEEWRAPAEAGEVAAQFSLGSLYFNGEGVSQDFDAAEKWFRKAAEQGHAGGQRT